MFAFTRVCARVCLTMKTIYMWNDFTFDHMVDPNILSTQPVCFKEASPNYLGKDNVILTLGRGGGGGGGGGG